MEPEIGSDGGCYRLLWAAGRRSSEKVVESEAHLVDWPAPTRAGWTLVAERVNHSAETVRQTLKKTNSSPG